MKADAIDWEKDLPPEPEEEYQALVRSLRRRKGFGLLFVECSPAEGEQVIERVKGDITNQKIEVLRLKEGVYKFYDIIENIPNRDDINILFVKGLEYSLFEYEEEKRREQGWENKDIYSYSWRGVPLVLINLNQQRERFRDNFNICFVFIMRPFAIDYLIQRAPDFFDWRSGVFKVSGETEIISGKDLDDLNDLSYEEREAQLREIKRLLEDNLQTANQKVDLLYQQGLLLVSGKRYEEAIVSFDESLKIKDDSYKSWHYKGVALNNVGRYEEALASFSKALEFEKNDPEIWIERGDTLFSLENYKEALSSLDEAIKLKPDFPKTWYYRGAVLVIFGRFQEAIASCDKAIELKANCYQAWLLRTLVLVCLGYSAHNQNLISSATKTIEFFQPQNSRDWNTLGFIRSHLKLYEEAINCYEKALNIEPKDYKILLSHGNAMSCLRRYQEAITSYDKALEIEPNYNIIWIARGNALARLGFYREAIASYRKGWLSLKEIGITVWQKKVTWRFIYRTAIGIWKREFIDFLKTLDLRRQSKNR